MEEVQSSRVSNEEKIDLLDMAVAVAENIKMLIFWPLLLGLCALGISFLLPHTYQSVAVLQADQSTASLMTTPVVLDPVIASLGLAKEDSVEEARTRLQARIKTAVGRTDKLLTLTVSAGTAPQSQAIANAVLEQTFQESRPKGSVRTRIEALLAEAQTRLKKSQDASEGVLKRLESSSSALNGGSELARGYAELLNATGAAQNQISTLEAQLEGVSLAQVIQPPTLPQKASRPKKGLIAIGVTLGTGLALLLFIFARQALRHSSISPASSAKLLHIRNSLGFK
jgi:capsular polysaccharide biosynthesis protein